MTGSCHRIARGWCLLLGLLPGLAAAGPVLELDAAEWARPRTAESVLSMTPLREAVRTWEQMPSARLVIRHPRGEAGLFWADELRNWLVALGVPSRSIAVEAGGGLEDRVELSVRRTNSGG